MAVSLAEAKNYLRVDFDDDDALISELLASARSICAAILREDSAADLERCENGWVAVMYAVAYLYEHREEADHNALTLTLRALLAENRRVVF